MAANNNVKFSTEAVNAAISNFNSRKEEFNSVVTNLKSAMYDLTGTWTGTASQSFRDRTDELFTNMLTIQNSVEGAIGKLQTAMAAYEATDSDNVAGINALETGTSDYV